MKNIIKQIIFLSVFISFLILPYFVFANESSALRNLKKVGPESGFLEDGESGGLLVIAGRVVQAFLSILGIVFIILFIYAGFMWMIASGDEGKLTKAKDTMRRAVIGLLIIFASWVFWFFISSALLLVNA